jgi:hypothetical protein
LIFKRLYNPIIRNNEDVLTFNRDSEIMSLYNGIYMYMITI